MPPRRVGIGLVASAVVIGIAGCGATQSSTSSSSTTASQEEAAKPCRHPAHIITGDRHSPFPGAVIGPVHNAWVAGNTTVWAGGQGYNHPNNGKFLIIRNGMAPHADSIYVNRAGALKITKAPPGCGGSSTSTQK